MMQCRLEFVKLTCYSAKRVCRINFKPVFFITLFSSSNCESSKVTTKQVCQSAIRHCLLKPGTRYYKFITFTNNTILLKKKKKRVKI
jgi:hypothetical protein